MATRITYQAGTVVLDKRTGVWYLRWRDADGRRRAYRIGTLKQYSSAQEASQCRAVCRMRCDINQKAEPVLEIVTVSEVAKRFIEEKLPPHFSTASDYQRLLKARILPRWGEIPISKVYADEVELWLKGLGLAPKTQANIKGLLRRLVEVAMLWRYLPAGRNPMELVTIPGCTIRQKEPEILTGDEFHQLLSKVSDEPLRTMLLFDLCLGLRFSELIALKWGDFDWRNLRVHIRRGAVRQRVGEVKTPRSRKPLPMDPQLAEVMLAWYRTTVFAAPGDWVWASPFRNGRQPYAYSKLYQALNEASKAAGLGVIGWHTMRHTYRSWLDETGAPMTVQQNLMRHSDIRTTMNIYGDAIPDSLRSAHSKVVRMVIQ